MRSWESWRQRCAFLTGGLLALTLAAALQAGDSAPPAGPASGKRKVAGDLKGPHQADLPVPADGEVLSIVAKAGKVGGQVQLGFGGLTRKNATLAITCVNMQSRSHHWATTKLPKDLEDAALNLIMSGAPGWKRRYQKLYFVRPDLHFYWGDDYQEALAKWQEYPPASQHQFDLRVARHGELLELSIDGRFFTRFEMDAAWKNLAVKLAEGSEVAAVYRLPSAETERFVPLDISVNPNQGAMKLAEMSLKPGLNTLAGVPVDIVAPEKHIDVGLARWLRQAKDSMSFYSPYYMRSGWDNVPETIILNVPKRFYNYAHVLCAVEPTAGKSPTMSVRVARYRQAWDGSGATQADTTVRIDPKAPMGCAALEQAGTLKAQISGREQALPLFLATIPLKTGELADYLGEDDWDTFYERVDYLYLELTREVATRVSRNYGVFEKLPLGPQSGLHVFGVTLEKAPVNVLIKSDEVGNIFYKSKQPSLSIEMVNPSTRPVRLTMTTRITDYFGQGQTAQKRFELKPGRVTMPYDLSGFDMGWYAAKFAFADEAGRAVWAQPLTFALLPPDTRKAGSESPYGTWWFAGSHYCERNADRVLPIVQKMGFRHVTPPQHDPKTGRTGENFARYKITPSMMRKIRGGDAEAETKKFMEQWPGTQYAMIFHETGLGGLGIGLPPELLGEPPTELEGKNLERFNTLHEHARKRAAAIRKAAPGVKIILGNGGTPFNVHWLRTKLSRDCWDCIGMETAIQPFHPEGQPTGWNSQSLWIAKRMREIYGYEDMPITSCYEYDYRTTAPGALSLEDQANWYARDVLHCLAYRVPNINVALIMDCNSSYYTSRWGSAGVCFRSPRMMPKPSFVALATLTSALDVAEYQRYLDTGSHSLYCLEFKKGNGLVYAIWATRGQRQAEVTFAQQAGSCRLIDLMGKERALPIQSGAATLSASEAPCFLLSSPKVTAVRAGPASHQNPELAAAHVIDKLDAPARWKVVEGGDERFQNYCTYKPLRKARVSPDRSKDGHLRITLHSQPDLPDVAGRYAIFEPAGGPLPMPGQPKGVGVWVNGNSNWGRVIFEVLDAKGRRWTSNGWNEALHSEAEKPNTWDMSDWEARTCINFDGWKFISMGLDLHYPSGYYAPDFRHWRCEKDNSITNQIAYPLRFNRLYVIMREKLVYVTDMVPAKSMSIELRDLTAFE